MSEKIGVVASGGGNHCGATAGAFHALSVVHGIDTPHVIVLVSGSFQAGMHYVARRFEGPYEWPRLFDNRKYVNFWRFWRMMDIDFLVDQILVPQSPDIYREAAKSSSKLFIATTELPSGRLCWLTKEHLAYGGLVKKAACAVPGVYGKEVRIGDLRLIDGYFSVTLAECVRKAFDEGAEKVIVIDTQAPEVSRAAGLLIKLLAHRQGPDVRAVVSRFLKRRAALVQPSEDVIVCRMHSLATRHPLDTKRERTMMGMQQGYAAMAALKI